MEAGSLDGDSAACSLNAASDPIFVDFHGFGGSRVPGLIFYGFLRFYMILGGFRCVLGENFFSRDLGSESWPY